MPPENGSNLMLAQKILVKLSVLQNMNLGKRLEEMWGAEQEVGKDRRKIRSVAHLHKCCPHSLKWPLGCSLVLAQSCEVVLLVGVCA